MKIMKTQFNTGLNSKIIAIYTKSKVIAIREKNVE